MAGRFFGLVTKDACDRQTDRQTDGQNYGQTDIQTDGQNYDSQDRTSIAALRGKTTKARFSGLLRHLAWKQIVPILVLALHKSVTYLLT